LSHRFLLPTAFCSILSARIPTQDFEVSLLLAVIKESNSSAPMLAMDCSSASGPYRYKLNALTRNTAIWPRVVEDVGQYSGGLDEHPDVIPSAAIRSMKL
jgi:hypothetical protein